MEPICEAKFYERSNGFRPNRSAENAIAQCYKMINLQKLYFVVDVDIKGFFDNVNHTKLIQQIWHMGIRDKKLLCIIREMLKAPIIMPDGTVEHPVKGTPQGGILSPLLSNIVLNELDWWIASQWENMPTKYEYSCEVRPNGTINKTAIYGAFKNTTKLKEVHIVRYADDFKLFCRKRSDAEKVFIAVKLWLQDRLKLEISEEKSKIVNLKRHYSKFLGFEMKAVKKRKRYVVKSHMTEKAISKETAALIEQVKQIAHVQDRDDEAREITLYNSMVFGIHNYYRYATMIATDCEQIHRAVSTVMKNRLYGRLTKKGQINEVYIRKNYGDSKQIRFISSKTVAPVGYIQTKTPLFKKKKVCKYTPEGRAEIHKNLGINTSIMLALMRIKEPRRSVEYMDNRISLYAAQYGRCAVTGKELWLDEIHCHHKQPLCRGGTDKYMNLVIVHRDMLLSYDGAANEFRMVLKGKLSHTAVLGADAGGNVTRIDNALEKITEHLANARSQLAHTTEQLENARTEMTAPFPKEAELAEKTRRLNELNVLLNLNEQDRPVMADEPDEGDRIRPKNAERER